MVSSKKPEPVAESARTVIHRRRVSERVEELQRTLRALFPSEKSVVLEVGCGHGHFLTAYATAHTSCDGQS